jgi:hypothetical protein
VKGAAIGVWAILGVLIACNGDVTDDSGSSSASVDTGTAIQPCSQAGAPPPDTETLAWDDGDPAASIDDFTWAYNGVELRDVRLNEAVRFELEHPALVHAFSVRWTQVPEDSEVELTAGLWRDFGHNGFDFWPAEAIWQGAICVSEIGEDGWVTYVLSEPHVVEQPGLVYVAHQRTGGGEPSFAMDQSYLTEEGTCGSFDDCHSSVNGPDEVEGSLYNGITFPIPYDYLVRLHVSYTQTDPGPVTFELNESITMSSRMAWGDYDGDGWDDIMTNGVYLWRNNGDGTFSDVTGESDLGVIAGDGGVWGDYDNDGCLDYFAQADSYSRADVLLHNNCDGTFSDVTAESGITDQQDYNDCDDAESNLHAPTAASAWLDVNGDGYLDLFMANMICWTNERTYSDNYFLNNGDGTFTDLSGENGFSGLRMAGRGAAPADVNGDGWVDLFVNNYRLNQNLFFVNLGDGLVDEDAAGSGVAGHKVSSAYGHTIGAVWGDLDNDLDLDLISANLAHPRYYDFSDKTQVLINAGDGTFTDKTEGWETPFSNPTGLRYQETHSVPVLSDVNNDGYLDLGITAVYDGRPTDFYWGNGDGTFTLDVYTAGLEAVENGWGIAASDYDNDGDSDWATSMGLYQNVLSDDNKGHWISVKAVGDVVSNREALGATVIIEAADKAFMRHVSGGNGQGCQDSSYLHFGLGELTSIDRITVDFPGSGVVVSNGPWDADQRIWVYESGTTATGWAP